MTTYAKGTRVPIARTREHIEGVLRRYGADQFLLERRWVTGCYRRLSRRIALSRCPRCCPQEGRTGGTQTPARCQGRNRATHFGLLLPAVRPLLGRRSLPSVSPGNRGRGSQHGGDRGSQRRRAEPHSPTIPAVKGDQEWQDSTNRHHIPGGRQRARAGHTVNGFPASKPSWRNRECPGAWTACWTTANKATSRLRCGSVSASPCWGTWRTG